MYVIKNVNSSVSNCQEKNDDPIQKNDDRKPFLLIRPPNIDETCLKQSSYMEFTALHTYFIAYHSNSLITSTVFSSLFSLLIAPQ